MYFDAIPLQKIFDILKKYDIIALQEDKTPWDGFLMGRESSTTFPVAYEASKDEDEFYEPIGNAQLYLYWYRMEESNRYEINSYMI